MSSRPPVYNLHINESYQSNIQMRHITQTSTLLRMKRIEYTFENEENCENHENCNMNASVHASSIYVYHDSL